MLQANTFQRVSYVHLLARNDFGKAANRNRGEEGTLEKNH